MTHDKIIIAARNLADALDAFDKMAEADEGQVPRETKIELNLAIIDAQYAVRDAVRAFDEALKETP